jgi:hypothetical protein
LGKVGRKQEWNRMHRRNGKREDIREGRRTEMKMKCRKERKNEGNDERM